MEEEYEYRWFWEVDGIYDIEGDLLIWSLMGVAIVSLQEAILISSSFTKAALSLWEETKN